MERVQKVIEGMKNELTRESFPETIQNLLNKLEEFIKKAN
jgi:hypothetical protein